MSRNTGPDPETRLAVYEREGGADAITGDADGPFQIHHRRPRGMGGTRREDTNGMAALVLLTEHSHLYVESNRAESYVNGWLVRQNQDPASVPFYYRNQWVLLTDDGQVLPASEAVVLEHLGVAS